MDDDEKQAFDAMRDNLMDSGEAYATSRYELLEYAWSLGVIFQKNRGE